MAVSDKSIEHLTKSIEGLVKTLKDRNTFGSDSSGGGTRLGRGGSSNATDASGDNFRKSLDSLKDLHKSMKSGGVSIADHFAKTVKNIVPLNKAISELEDVFEHIADEFGKQYEKIAKSAAEYIKQNKGNASKLRHTAKLHEEYTEVQKEILKIHQMGKDDLKKNATEIRKLIDKEKDLRERYNNSEFAKANELQASSGTFIRYMHSLTKAMKSLNPSNVKLKGETLKKIEKDIVHFEKVNKTIHQVFTTFANNMEKNLREAEKKVKDSLDTFARALGSAAMDSVRRIPGLITSRVQHGLADYDMLDSAHMGMSPEELHAFRSGLRDVTNVMTQFGQNDVNVTDTLRGFHHQLKDIGLTGVEASEYLAQVSRDIYRTGRTLDEESLNRMNNVAQNIQQIFGGTIADASKRFHDYNTQVFNLARYNAAQSDAEREVLEAELVQRMKLAKYMGIEVEHLIQQQALRNNNAMQGLTEAIRGAVSGRVGLEIMRQDGLGISSADAQFRANVDALGIDSVSEEDQRRYHMIGMEMERYRQAHVDRQRDAFAASGGDMGAAITASAMGRIGMQYAGSGGIDMGQNQRIYAPAIAMYEQHRQAGTLEQFDIMAAMQAAESEPNDLERSVMGISESIRGFLKGPFGALTAAVTANTIAVAANTAMLILGRRGVARMFGRRRTPPVTPGTPRVGTPNAVAPKAGTPNSPRVGGLGRMGRMRLGSPISMATGIVLGGAADALGTDTKAGAGMDVLADTAGWAGTGALIGSIVPGVGTAIGGAIGGVAGGGYSLYKNRETLLEGITPDTMKGITKGSMIGSMVLPGIGSVVGGALGGLFSRETKVDTGSITEDRTATSFSAQTDAMNNIARDNQGNPIVVDDRKSEEYLEKIAQFTEKQVNLTEEGMLQERMREEQRDAQLARQNSVKEHIDGLAGTIGRAITVPS